MPHKTELLVMTNKDTKLASVLQVSLQTEVDHAFKTDVQLTLSVKFVITPEELLSVFNVLPHLTDFWQCLNSDANVLRVSLSKVESADHAHQVVLSAQMPQFVKDALSQRLTTTTELVPVLKATSLLLSQLDSARDVNNTVSDVLQTTTVSNASQVSWPLQTENAYAPEEDT